MMETVSASDNRSSHWHKTGLRVCIAAAAILCSFFVTLFVLKTQMKLEVRYDTSLHAVDQPLTATLSQITQSVSSEDITITPNIEGAWSFRRGTLFADGALTFTPSKKFAPGATYRVTIASIKRLIGGSIPAQHIEFTTEVAPGIADEGIMKLKDGQVLPAENTFHLALSKLSTDERDLQLKTKPSVELVRQADTDKKGYSWRPKGLLPQGIELTLEVYDSSSNKTLATKRIHTATEPAIATPVKVADFGPSDTATIVFNQPIAPSGRQAIVFDTEGAGIWADPLTYRFTPKKLEPGKTYRYTIKAGLKSVAGGVATVDRTAEFSTVGAVTVIAASPTGANMSKASQQISFTFSQPVDRASAVSRFSISNGQLGAITWVGNTMRASVTNMDYQTRVTAKIAAGVINTGFGLPSAQAYTVSFITEARSLRTKIPYLPQRHNSTCTAASLRMILASKGIAADEMNIVERMGYKPRDMDKSTGVSIWDDPKEMFVGSVDGTLAKGTGAGVDAEPVAKAARTFGVSAQ